MYFCFYVNLIWNQLFCYFHDCYYPPHIIYSANADPPALTLMSSSWRPSCSRCCITVTNRRCALAYWPRSSARLAITSNTYVTPGAWRWSCAMRSAKCSICSALSYCCRWMHSTERLIHRISLPSGVLSASSASDVRGARSENRPAGRMSGRHHWWRNGDVCSRGG